MAPFSFRISFSLWWSLFFVIVLRYCLKGKDYKRNTISLVKSLAGFVPSISSSNPKILALELSKLMFGNIWPVKSHSRHCIYELCSRSQ